MSGRGLPDHRTNILKISHLQNFRQNNEKNQKGGKKKTCRYVM